MRILNQIVQKVKRSAAALTGASLMLAGALSAHAGLAYYTASILATNQYLTNGITWLTNVNYPATGGFFNTQGVTPSDPNATGLTFSFTYGSVSTNVSTNAVLSTNSAAASLIANIGLWPDQASIAPGLGIPPVTNITVSVTNTMGTNGVLTTSAVFVPGTNFGGLQWGKILNVNYTGTNYIFIKRARAGCWVEQ